MHTQACAALAVCLLFAGCQSSQMPSFGRWNRSLDTAALASAREAQPSEPPAAEPTSRDGIRQVSYNRTTPVDHQGQAVADAFEQARTADARGQVDVARSHYQRVLELDPAHADSLHALGILADKQGDYRTAETHYLRALRAKPEDANLLSDLGYSYFLQARRHDAEWYLREALKNDPQHAKARGNLELLFNEQKAFETYRQLLGEREAATRMSALFPEAASGAARTAGSRPAHLNDGYAAHPHGGYQGHPAQPGARQAGPHQNTQTWPAASSTAAAEHSAMQHLRAEMERERLNAAAASQHQYREPLTAPAVASDAFHEAGRQAGWPGEHQRSYGGPGSSLQGQSANWHDPSGRAAQPPQSTGSAYPQQFSDASSTTGTPYGQWNEPPQSSGSPSRGRQAAAPAGTPEPWPHAPGANWPGATQPESGNGRDPRRTAYGDAAWGGAYQPTTSQHGNAPEAVSRQLSQYDASSSAVNRAAQRVGMEGALFPSPGPNATAAHAASHPATAGVAPAAAISREGSTAGGWNEQPRVQTADGWRSAPVSHARPGAPEFEPSPRILITPGTSGMAPTSVPPGAGAADRTWSYESEAPRQPQDPRSAAGQPWPHSPGTPSASPQWPPQYNPSASRPAETGSIPSYWQDGPGATGWNGQ